MRNGNQIQLRPIPKGWSPSDRQFLEFPSIYACVFWRRTTKFYGSITSPAIAENYLHFSLGKNNQDYFFVYSSIRSQYFEEVRESTPWVKKIRTLFVPITLTNVDRLSKFLHIRTQQWFWNELVINDPNTT